MKESGCTAIFFGIESGSARIQMEIKKKLDLDGAIKIIRFTAGLGMVTIASYMAGFPGETRRDLNDTLRSILEVALAGARPQLTLLSILPGTPLYAQHIDKLEYDGVHSAFSAIHPTEKMKQLIMGDRKAFSSFYFLPNEQIARHTYLFLADLVNNLEHFLPTLIAISEHIRKVLLDADFLRIVEENLVNYRYGPDIPLPELYFLTDSLKKYLEYLQDRGLPSWTWDVFQVDFTKAFMIAKYERWKITKAAYRNGRRIFGKPEPEDVIKPLPFWKLIETSCYLHDYVSDPVGLKGRARFRKGCYHYIVLPVSHRMAKLIKVPGIHVQVFRDLKESTVGEFIRKNVVILGEDRSYGILRQMIRRGLVAIEKNSEQINTLND